MALIGGWKGRLAAEGPLPDSGLGVTVLDEEEEASSLLGHSSGLATCTAHRDLPAPAWGKARGRNCRGVGLTGVLIRLGRRRR